jgi:hypothetical protein
MDDKQTHYAAPAIHSKAFSATGFPVGARQNSSRQD